MLWLVKGLGQGGMERLLVTHARFGDHERFDYQAAFLVPRPHSVTAELIDLDVPVHQLGDGSGSVSFVRDLRRLLTRERIDVVHAHSPMPASFARPVARTVRQRPRFVYTEHNRWSRYSAMTRVANRMTYGLNDQSFAVSEECTETMPVAVRQRVEVVIHGVDVDAVRTLRSERSRMRAELGIEEGAVVVGTVANLRPQKNYPMLLDTAAHVLAARSDVVFLAVGQGPLENAVRAQHDRLGLGDRFRLLGFRDDVHRVMSAFDILCFSSTHEGLPVALMEGRALGLPVVATAVGGLRDHVRMDIDGTLVPPNNAAALATGLLELAGDNERRDAFSRASAEAADAYRAERWVQTVESAYLRG